MGKYIALLIVTLLTLIVACQIHATPSPPKSTAQKPKIQCDLMGHCVRISSKSTDKWLYLGMNAHHEKFYLNLTTAYIFRDPRDGSLSVDATVKFKGKNTGTMIAAVDCTDETIVLSLDPTRPIYIPNMRVNDPATKVARNIYGTLCTMLKHRR